MILTNVNAIATGKGYPLYTFFSEFVYCANTANTEHFTIGMSMLFKYSFTVRRGTRRLLALDVYLSLDAAAERQDVHSETRQHYWIDGISHSFHVLTFLQL